MIEPDEQDRPVARGVWTRDEKQTLESGFAEGLTDAAIAAQLPARSERAVTLQRHRMGLANYGRQTRTKTPGEVRVLKANHEGAIAALEDARRMIRNRIDRQTLIEYLDASITLYR